MNKIIKWILIVMLALPNITKACDICGCGAGNAYIGVLPDFKKKIIGLRYRYNNVRTHIGLGGATTYLTTNESYKVAEVWAGWNIGKKFRLMASLPYNFNERNTATNKAQKNGLGDIILSGYYQLLNKRTPVMGTKLLVQSLWVGAGIKAPTGKYETADKNGRNQNANLFQLGTASTDFLIQTMYDVRLNDVGLNISANYKMNTNNKYDYNYGNKLSINGQLYYKFNINNKCTLAPNLGVQWEQSQKDIDNKTLVDLSGGRLLTGTFGVETSFKALSMGANFQPVLQQNLASGFVQAGNRGMVHVAISL
ncbi:transporter [Ferruginibacter yonginensis]|uniref:Transporter n=1 Tax=Ferruginibacter yonginensis TaxID=1310416 RepID=A0ABV8QT65_9BACT